MVNRVQVGYPAVMKIIEKPKPIEIGNTKLDFLLFGFIHFTQQIFKTKMNTWKSQKYQENALIGKRIWK